MNAFARTSRFSVGVVVALVAALSLGVGAALQPVVAEGTSYLTQTFRIGAATPYNLTWPEDDGAADGVLQTDGSGALTWATDLDVAGGLEAGSGDVALVGTDGKINGPLSSTILDDLSGANLTGLDAGQITSGTFGATRIAANAVGRSELRTATGSATGTGNRTISMNDYSFFPSIRISTNDSCDTRVETRLMPSISTSTNTTGRFRVLTSASCTVNVAWRYITSSDTPSVWAVVAADGALVALWESEDPVSDGDTEAPLATDESTHRVVNMGLPSLAVITTLADALTADQQADLLARLDTYMADERGWLAAVTALADLATIETRYEPSGRQWAMRFLAEVRGISVTELYRTDLAVDTATDTWVVPSE